MLHRIKKIWKPAIYQGKDKMKGYFEGWYFKIVDKKEENIYAIIPGVAFDNDGNAHSFIQFFNGRAVSMNYFEYDISQFEYSKERFNVKVGDNTFSTEGFELNINKKDQIIKGKIKQGKLISWPVKPFSPGVMGWYRFVPRMECYHGILSFDHSLEGKLIINGIEIDFTGGRGYLEKDYGRSFPAYYLWGQTNHFDKQYTSLMISFAKIPWLGSYFDGFIIGFLLEKKLFRFATYTGARISKLKLTDTKVIIHTTDNKHRLEIEAIKSGGVQLPSPKEGSMTGRILESITAEIHVKLYGIKKKNENLLFEGIGKNAGLDIGGNVEEIPKIE